MSRLATAFVLGYHGCSREEGERFLSGDKRMESGADKYHWLGPGVYFWEGDPNRALEWARAKEERGALVEPFVVGAVIDLGNCLDFQVRENVQLLKEAYRSFSDINAAAGTPLPKNKPARNDRRDANVLRYLDFAVINHLLTLADANGNHFDTVRGVFAEGDLAYPGAGIQDQSHSQIAVRTLKSIKGLFRVASSD